MIFHEPTARVGQAPGAEEGVNRELARFDLFRYYFVIFFS